MASSYSLSKKMPSCRVDKVLLGELEQYIKQKFETLSPKITYELNIKDSIGTETFNSIEEYNMTYFPNDTKNISIKCRTSDYRMETNVSFDISLLSSELSIKINGGSARENALSLSEEILRRINPYKTNNDFFSVFSPYGVLIGVVFSILWIGSVFNAFLSSNYILIAIIVLLLGCIGWIIFALLLPYCTFKTRRNEKLETAIKWIILGMIGFILFTVIGVYYRQKLLGF